MSTKTDIPSEWSMLVECLRGALHHTPAPAALQNTDWSTLLRQARQHSVEHFLFPWLAQNIPQLFSADADVTPDSAPAAWRALALEHLRATIIRQQQTTVLLRNFSAENIDVIPLKGTWLSENIYDEPSQRSMVDLDILVRKINVERAHQLLNKLGYKSKHNTRDSVYMCDESYYHPQHKVFVELHWNVESEMTGDHPIPDIDAIWNKVNPSTLLGQPAQEFTLEDQLAHLVQHIIHHQLAVPLKAYVDIALLIKKRGAELSYPELTASAEIWKTGSALPFIIRMVSDLLATVIPAQLKDQIPVIEASLLKDALQSLFALPAASQRVNELNLLKYRDSSAIARIKLIIQRIFMPQSFMVMRYPFARHALLLPLAWSLRTITLLRHAGGQIISADAADPYLENARLRDHIIKNLTCKR